MQNQLVITLDTWKQTELITYEWLQQVNIVDDLLISKINQTSYSDIIILGSELKPSTLSAATKIQDKHLILLSDATYIEPVIQF